MKFFKQNDIKEMFLRNMPTKCRDCDAFKNTFNVFKIP